MSTNPANVRVHRAKVQDEGSCHACQRSTYTEPGTPPDVFSIKLGGDCTITVRLCPECLGHLRAKTAPDYDPWTGSLEDLTDKTSAWAEATFPGQSTAAKAEHLVREAQELLRTPWDSEEMADVLLLLCHIAQRGGVDLLRSAYLKLEVNKKRVWGEPDTDGVYHHVKDHQKPTFRHPGCSNELAQKGLAYPRTCAECGLGPCKYHVAPF